MAEAEQDCLLEHALNYARSEWPILPLHSVRQDGQCSCGKPDCDCPGKHPRTQRAVKDATTDEAQVREWWAKWPDANIGIATGNGLVVLAAEGKKGIDELKKLRSKHGDPPATPIAGTGNGLHLYFRLPPGLNEINRTELAPGLHMKTNGCYVVAPPSVRADGRLYKWEVSPEEADTAEAPDWLVRLASDHSPRATRASAPYRVTRSGIMWLKPAKHGPVDTLLTNFTARIVAEVVKDDGSETTRLFEIEARLEGRRRLFTVPAKEFARMDWVTRELGARAIVYPGYTIKDHARTAIQALSKVPEARTIYAHTGWRKVSGRQVYLHAAGAIGHEGVVPGVETNLSTAGLDRFALPEPPEGKGLAEAVRTSLRLQEVAPLAVTVPLFAAIWRAAIGQDVPFTVHLVGQTGVGKTAVAALAQQHWGAGLDAHHLPASWSSTANALEAQAFTAKDALLVVDDFAPGGSVNDVGRLQHGAARILRAQGNLQGRGRLRPDATLRPSKWPRGLILSTGEDVPGGQSIRARCLIVEVLPGSVDFGRLTEAQHVAAKGIYAQAMAGFVRWLAPRIEEVWCAKPGEVAALRAEAGKEGAHQRTPDMVAELGFALRLFLQFAVEAAAIPEPMAERSWSKWWSILRSAGEAQATHQVSSDPVQRYIELLRAAIVSGRAHVATPDGGAPQGKEGAWGWRRKADGSKGKEWMPQGDRVGWVAGEDLYLEPQAAYSAAVKMAAGTHESLGVSEATLRQRLNEKGLLRSREKKRGVLTVRRTLDGGRRGVLHLPAEALVEAGECAGAGA